MSHVHVTRDVIHTLNAYRYQMLYNAYKAGVTTDGSLSTFIFSLGFNSLRA